VVIVNNSGFLAGRGGEREKDVFTFMVQGHQQKKIVKIVRTVCILDKIKSSPVPEAVPALN
jgi:hypothetical protein